MAYRGEAYRARGRLHVTVVALAGAVLTAACGSVAPARNEEAATTFPVSATASTPPPDVRFLRVKEALASSGLVADMNDDTVLAVVRGTCDQLSAGVPQQDVLATLRSIAAYAAAVSGTQMSADDAALLYLETARETYC